MKAPPEHPKIHTVNQRPVPFSAGAELPILLCQRLCLFCIPVEGLGMATHQALPTHHTLPFFPASCFHTSTTVVSEPGERPRGATGDFEAMRKEVKQQGCSHQLESQGAL